MIRNMVYWEVEEDDWLVGRHTARMTWNLSHIAQQQSTNFHIRISRSEPPNSCKFQRFGLLRIYSDIRPFLQLYDFAAFALQETKQSSAVKQTELVIPNYRLFRRDRIRNDRNGGGVGICARTDLKPRKISLRSAQNLEFIAVQLLMKKEKIAVASVNKPP